MSQTKPPQPAPARPSHPQGHTGAHTAHAWPHPPLSPGSEGDPATFEARFKCDRTESGVLRCESRGELPDIGFSGVCFSPGPESGPGAFGACLKEKRPEKFS